MWFYEAASQEVPKAERLWAVGVQLEEEAETVFARGSGWRASPWRPIR